MLSERKAHSVGQFAFGSETCWSALKRVLIPPTHMFHPLLLFHHHDIIIAVKSAVWRKKDSSLRGIGCFGVRLAIRHVSRQVWSPTGRMAIGERRARLSGDVGILFDSLPMGVANH